MFPLVVHREGFEMRMSRRRGFIAAAAAAFLAGGLLIGIAGPAAGYAGCQAYGDVPSKLVVNQDDEILHSTLHGVVGCSGYGYDMWGASAYLDGPEGAQDYLSWGNFGDSYRIDLYGFDVTPGVYRVEDGEVDLYDQDFNQIPTDWSPRSMNVRFEGRVNHFWVTHSGLKVTVTGRTERFKPYSGFVGYTHKPVAVQRQLLGGNHWTTFATATSNSSGNVSYSYYTSAKWVYRLYFASSTSVWSDVSSTKYI
jgi:hypothetical protein